MFNNRYTELERRFVRLEERLHALELQSIDSEKLASAFRGLEDEWLLMRDRLHKAANRSANAAHRLERAQSENGADEPQIELEAPKTGFAGKLGRVKGGG